MIYSDNEKAIIWLDSFCGLTKEQKLNIINVTKNPAAIFNDVTLIKKCVGKNISDTAYNVIKSSLSLNIAETVIADLNKLGIVAVTCMSDGYPERFLEIPDPPLIIYCKGNLNLLSSKHSFSIVGSRKTLPVILSKAEEFSGKLTEGNVTVVTGLAEGVDSAAIKGALKSGRIISILPGGFKHIYPEFNRSLYEKVAENGLVITEYNPDMISKPYHFPERNRLIAALGDGVLVCSAGKKSGTSYTADFANSYGKSVFAFPYTIGVSSGEGCNALIKEYALLCDSVEDIFLSLGITAKSKETFVKLTEDEKRVFNCIKDGEIHIDLLLKNTGMQIYEISPLLAMLEIKKYIVKNPGNTYSSIK